MGRHAHGHLDYRFRDTEPLSSKKQFLGRRKHCAPDRVFLRISWGRVLRRHRCLIASELGGVAQTWLYPGFAAGPTNQSISSSVSSLEVA